MKITKRQLRRVIREFFGTREKSAIVAPAYKRAPELKAILDAAEMAHSSKDISYSQLKNFLFDLNATYATDRKIMEITRQQLRQVIVETLDLDDYYEERRRQEVEELYLDDLQSLKAIVDSYGAVDMQRLMGDVKKERHLQRYNLNDIEDMLDELYNNDEIDYDEGSRQWVAV